MSDEMNTTAVPGLGRTTVDFSDDKPTPEKVWYVLYDDGTWAGGFGQEHIAHKVRDKKGGQVVEGVWF